MNSHEYFSQGGSSTEAACSLRQGLSYGVFGLGNKQYEHFCAVGKRVHKALGALGGKALVRRGDGDDDEDIEADFESWRTEIYTGLDKCEALVKTTVSAGHPGMHMADASLPASLQSTSYMFLLCCLRQQAW